MIHPLLLPPLSAILSLLSDTSKSFSEFGSVRVRLRDNRQSSIIAGSCRLGSRHRGEGNGEKGADEEITEIQGEAYRLVSWVDDDGEVNQLTFLILIEKPSLNFLCPSFCVFPFPGLFEISRMQHAG